MGGSKMGDEQLHRGRELRYDCERFLYHAAELLDDRRLNEWHKLLTEDVSYRVPIRTTRERSSSDEFSETTFHMKEDWDTLKVRTERMASDFAWSEDPPSRTRRQVSNVRVTDVSNDEISLKNNLVIVRSQKDETDPDILSMERRDTLRRDDDGYGSEWSDGPKLKLAERTVFLDHTVIPVDSLSIIL